MKTFKKVLASALAAAMVVTAFPVTNAEAATAPKLSTKKATLYVGQSKTIKVTLPKGAKITSVKTSKKAVATVKKSGKKVVVKAVKAGTAKVTVKVTPKTGKAKTLKATITVKNPSLALKAASEVAVGATEQITATVKPASTKVTYTSSDKEIATVDAKGVVTGVKAGDATITIKAGKTTKTVKMTVKDYVLKDVKQATTTKLTATVAGNTANLKASDFVITNTYSKANIAVKSVSVDATDKTQVTVETYVPMADGKDYTVTLADVTKTITATDGKVTAIAITPSTVTVPTPTVEAGKTNPNTVVITYTDANGVVVATTDVAKKDSPEGFAYLEVTTDATNNGYFDGAVLNLFKAGNSAKVKATLHTGKYDASAQEVGNITAEATITGVDAAAVTVTGWNVKTVKAAVKTPSTTAYKDVKETKVAVGDDIVVYVQKATSDNKADKASGYTFESSNNDVMTVSNGDDLKDASAVNVKAYKEGSAYIIVKDGKGNVVTTIPVAIGAARKAVSLSLDKNTFSFSSVTVDDVTVKASAKDQYGEDFAIDAITCVDPKGDAAGTLDKNTVKIAKSSFATDKDGTYAYIVKYGDLKTTFVVTVKKADVAKTYDLSVDAETDAIVKKDTEKNTTVTAKVYGYDANGNIAKNDLTFKSFELSKDGKAVTEDASGALATTGVININDVSKGTQMAAGTYVIKAVVTIDGKDSTFSKAFVVKNTQAAASVSRVNTSGKTFADCFEVKYDGEKQTDVKYFGADGKEITASEGAHHVAYAEVTVSYAKAKVVVKANIGLTVTITK